MKLSSAETMTFSNTHTHTYICFFFLEYISVLDLRVVFVEAFNNISHFLSVFTEKYCTANHVDKLPGPRDWVQILQDQIKLARRRLKRGSGMNVLQENSYRSPLLNSQAL